MLGPSNAVVEVGKAGEPVSGKGEFLGLLVGGKVGKVGKIRWGPVLDANRGKEPGQKADILDVIQSSMFGPVGCQTEGKIAPAMQDLENGRETGALVEQRDDMRGKQMRNGFKMTGKGGDIDRRDEEQFADDGSPEEPIKRKSIEEARQQQVVGAEMVAAGIVQGDGFPVQGQGKTGREGSTAPGLAQGRSKLVVERRAIVYKEIIGHGASGAGRSWRFLLPATEGGVSIPEEAGVIQW